MRIVVDANVFISAFLRDSKTRELLLSTDLELILPSWLIDELEKNKDELKSKLGSSAKFDSVKEMLLKYIELVPFGIWEPYLKEAGSLINDAKDVPYIALCLALNIPLWSNDKPLKRQSRARVLSTNELLKLLR